MAREVHTLMRPSLLLIIKNFKFTQWVTFFCYFVLVFVSDGNFPIPLIIFFFPWDTNALASLCALPAVEKK